MGLGSRPASVEVGLAIQHERWALGADIESAMCMPPIACNRCSRCREAACLRHSICGCRLIEVPRRYGMSWDDLASFQMERPVHRHVYPHGRPQPTPTLSSRRARGGRTDSSRDRNTSHPYKLPRRQIAHLANWSSWGTDGLVPRSERDTGARRGVQTPRVNVQEQGVTRGYRTPRTSARPTP